MLVWIWLNSIFWSVAPLCGWSRYALEPSMTTCNVDMLHPDSGYASYMIACFLICYVLPIAVMMICRVKIASSMKSSVVKQEPENYGVIFNFFF